MAIKMLDGAPAYPGFGSLIQNGELSSLFQLNPNTQALNYLREEGSRGGPSTWANMQLGNLNEAGLRSGVNQTYQGNYQNTLNDMQSRGVTKGAQERLTKNLALQKMMGNQDVTRNVQNMKNEVLSTDMQQRQDIQQSLPGLELEALKPQQFNIQAFLDQKRTKDLADAKRYQSQMEAWASANTSNATANSGKK